MKNRKLTFVLLPLAVIIWGGIVYRFLQAQDYPVESKSISPISTKTHKSDILPDTFVLLADYRDPFERKVPAKIENPSGMIEGFSSYKANISSKVNDSKPVVSVTEPVRWPDISYFGLIENRAKKTRVAICRLGGVDYFVEEGQTVTAIKVVKVWQDSILVNYQKENRIFKRKD